LTHFSKCPDGNCCVKFSVKKINAIILGPHSPPPHCGVCRACSYATAGDHPLLREEVGRGGFKKIVQVNGMNESLVTTKCPGIMSISSWVQNELNSKTHVISKKLVNSP